MHGTLSLIPTTGGKKETVKRIKRETTDFQKIFVKVISGKGLLPKIYKEFY
jgi:hypothetical protein